jgi:hypothetical protein
MLIRSPQFLIATVLLAAFFLSPSQSYAEVYELRTYTANEGKLPDLLARFRDHTIRLFKKHGMESVGYWVPTEKPQSTTTLIYILKHESREASKKSFRSFGADPEWRKAYQESRVNGSLLSKLPDSVFMEAADYNPDFNSGKNNDVAVFELRIYKTNEGKLPNLDARFRDHTIRIFAKHGMQSVAYWHPSDESNTLIYILKHKSSEAAKKSWPAFGTDEEWKKVSKESQLDGAILSERPASTYMKATDFSAIK